MELYQEWIRQVEKNREWIKNSKSKRKIRNLFKIYFEWNAIILNGCHIKNDYFYLKNRGGKKDITSRVPLA